MTSWIVLADSHHARIYVQWRRNAPLVLLEEIQHLDAKLRARDMLTDRPGVRAGKGSLPRSNSAVSSSDPEELEEGRFLHMLGERLDSGRVQHEFSELVFVMPARTFGHLLEELHPRTYDMIVEHIPRNYLHLDDASLARRIQEATAMRPATTVAVRARRNANQPRALPKSGARRPQDGRVRGVRNPPKGRLR